MFNKTSKEINNKKWDGNFWFNSWCVMIDLERIKHMYAVNVREASI